MAREDLGQQRELLQMQGQQQNKQGKHEAWNGGLVTGKMERAGKPSDAFIFTSKTPKSLCPEAGFKKDSNYQ